MSTALGERDGPCHLDMLHMPESQTAAFRHWTVSDVILEAQLVTMSTRIRVDLWLTPLLRLSIVGL
jgi:hypothetical protein